MIKKEVVVEKEEINITPVPESPYKEVVVSEEELKW